jgi:phosphoglucosamine mutase
MQKLPQRLVNVRAGDRSAIVSAMDDPAVQSAIESEQDALSGRGRVLVRPSGTEPLIRVMVEAPGETETDEACQRLVAVIERTVGVSAPG